MTDKVQKIREEVERLYNQSLVDENRQTERGLERAANVSYGKSKACNELISFIDSLQDEPVSEDFEEAAKDYAENHNMDFVEDDDDCYWSARYAFKAGAQWQKEQFENNRLKHCDSITNEQAELEQGFVDQHLDKNKRIPTFLDAIEYGMNLQKEQMMAKAVDGEVTYGKSLAIPSLGYFLDKNGLDFGDKVKVIIIKENKDE